MKNQLILIKAKQRLNKKASFDFDNLEAWEIVEAFNKAQIEYARRESRKGEDTKQDIDSLQVILKNVPLKGTNQAGYFESAVLPEDYLTFKRVSFAGTTAECADKRPFIVYEAEEANLDLLYLDPEKNPNFEWGETFITLINKKIHIHTDNKFTIHDPRLVYYRKPLDISIVGVVDPSTGIDSLKEQECEFKDDVVELLIDETVLILAGDLESTIQMQRTAQSITRP